MKKQTAYQKAKCLLVKRYRDLTTARKQKLMDKEIHGLILLILNKWEDVPFLSNLDFACELEKEEWEAALKEIENKD